MRKLIALVFFVVVSLPGYGYNGSEYNSGFGQSAAYVPMVSFELGSYLPSDYASGLGVKPGLYLGIAANYADILGRYLDLQIRGSMIATYGTEELGTSGVLGYGVDAGVLFAPQIWRFTPRASASLLFYKIVALGADSAYESSMGYYYRDGASENLASGIYSIGYALDAGLDVRVKKNFVLGVGIKYLYQRGLFVNDIKGNLGGHVAYIGFGSSY